MKRVKHFLLASCLFPTLLGAQEMASAYFLELTPDAQSAGMAGTGLATTDNGSTAIFHNASTIAFSQEVMGASYSYAKINQDYALHSASLFYRIGREGIHGTTSGCRLLLPDRHCPVVYRLATFLPPSTRTSFLSKLSI